MTVNAGTLDLGGNSQAVTNLNGLAGVVTSSVPGAITLTVNPTAASNFGGTLKNGAGTLSLAMNGPGLLTLSGINTYSGGTVLSGGTLDITNAASLGTSSGGLSLGAATLEVSGIVSSGRNLTLTSSAATISVDGSQSFSNSGTISGAGGLTLTGQGLLTLAGSNTFTGNVAISGGTVQLINPGNGAYSGLGNPGTAGRIISINQGGTLSLNVPNGNAFGNGAQTPAFATVINGGQLVETAYGNTCLNTVTLNGGTMTANGPTSVFTAYEVAGTVTVGGSSASTINGTGGVSLGTYAANGYQTTFNVGLTGPGGTVSSNPDLTISTPLTNSAGNSNSTGLNKTGPGILLLTGADTFTGAMTISNGTLELGNPLALQNSPLAYNLPNSLVFATGNTTYTLGGLSGSANLALTGLDSNPVGLNINGASGSSSTYSGALSGAGSLSNAGGTLFLSNSNTSFTGPINVTGGALFLNNTGVLPSAWQNPGTNIRRRRRHVRRHGRDQRRRRRVQHEQHLVHPGWKRQFPRRREPRAERRRFLALALLRKPCQ